MKYRVLPGETVTWPDGSVRANADEVFEAYTDTNLPEQRAIARRWMHGQWEKVSAAGDDAAITAKAPVPTAFYKEMHQAGVNAGLRMLTRGQTSGAD